jgi:aryl-alcohol dehydrogenase-like predicted oxidoreductase
LLCLFVTRLLIHNPWHNVPAVYLHGARLISTPELVGDEDAYQTLEAAWNAGVHYYDVAPWYGLGLAERRLDRPVGSLPKLRHCLRRDVVMTAFVSSPRR